MYASEKQGARYLDFRPGAPDTADNGCMVEGVAEHEAALAHQGRDDHRIGCKAHAKGDCILTPDKLGYFPIKLKMLVCGTYRPSGILHLADSDCMSTMTIDKGHSWRMFQLVACLQSRSYTYMIDDT